MKRFHYIRIKDVITALSLSNLCFLPVWRYVIYSLDPHGYHLEEPFMWRNTVGLMLDVLLLATLFWASYAFARRQGQERLLGLGRWVFLFVVFVALLCWPPTRKSGACDEALGIAIGLGSLISFACMLMASQVGEPAALRLHATELMMMLGTAVSTTLSGRSISRTGRYKHFPILGLALRALALVLLATLSVAPSRVRPAVRSNPASMLSAAWLAGSCATMSSSSRAAPSRSPASARAVAKAAIMAGE